MAFTASLEMINGVAHITLTGELDAAVAPQFRTQIEEAAQAQAKRLVLFMGDLSYMASAGLRVLAFAKQKMGADVDIYMVAVQEHVLETLRMTGLHHSVYLVDSYDAAQMEAV